MVTRMLTDDVDDGNVGATGVVQIGETVGETGAEMQQSAAGFLRHASEAIRGSSDYTFEQAEDATHFRHAVERCDQMNF